MARRKNQPDSVRVKCFLSERLRQIRVELYGERGGSEMARRLSLPIRTWYNYESGVTVPAEVMLRFVELTNAEPMWLLHGKGPKFRAAAAPAGGDSVEALLRTALLRLEAQGPDTNGSAARDSDENDLIRVDGADHERITNEAGPRYQAAHREWLAAHRDCRSLRIEGDAMAPVVADGAFVAYSEDEDDLGDLTGNLVVAWVEGKPIVRWFELSGRFAVLRAENPACEPATVLIDLDGPASARRVRKVLWISTPH